MELQVPRIVHEELDGERGEQDTAKRVAEGVAEATIERLDREGAAVVLGLLGRDLRGLELEHEWRCPSFRGSGPAGRAVPGQCPEACYLE